MLFVDERKLIVKWAFDAIKAAFGVQEKLKKTEYSLVEFNDDLSVKYGWFHFIAKSGKRYRVLIDNEQITHLSIIKE